MDVRFHPYSGGACYAFNSFHVWMRIRLCSYGRQANLLRSDDGIWFLVHDFMRNGQSLQFFSVIGILPDVARHLCSSSRRITISEKDFSSVIVTDTQVSGHVPSGNHMTSHFRPELWSRHYHFA